MLYLKEEPYYDFCVEGNHNRSNKIMCASNPWAGSRRLLCRCSSACSCLIIFSFLHARNAVMLHSSPNDKWQTCLTKHKTGEAKMVWEKTRYSLSIRRYLIESSDCCQTWMRTEVRAVFSTIFTSRTNECLWEMLFVRISRRCFKQKLKHSINCNVSELHLVFLRLRLRLKRNMRALSIC